MQIVYHGTTSTFNNFKAPEFYRREEDRCFFFTNKKSMAWEYASISFGGELMRVLEVKLLFKNPMTHDFKFRPYDSVLMESIISIAKKNGNDGLIIKNIGEGFYGDMYEDQYIVWDANIIKIENIIYE